MSICIKSPSMTHPARQLHCLLSEYWHPVGDCVVRKVRSHITSVILEADPVQLAEMIEERSLLTQKWSFLPQEDRRSPSPALGSSLHFCSKMENRPVQGQHRVGTNLLTTAFERRSHYSAKPLRLRSLPDDLSHFINSLREKIVCDSRDDDDEKFETSFSAMDLGLM